MVLGRFGAGLLHYPLLGLPTSSILSPLSPLPLPPSQYNGLAIAPSRRPPGVYSPLDGEGSINCEINNCPILALIFWLMTNTHPKTRLSHCLISFMTSNTVFSLSALPGNGPPAEHLLARARRTPAGSGKSHGLHITAADYSRYNNSETRFIGGISNQSVFYK